MQTIDLTNNPISNIEQLSLWPNLQRVLIGGTAIDGAEDCDVIDTVRERGAIVIVDSRIDVMC